LRIVFVFSNTRDVSRKQQFQTTFIELHQATKNFELVFVLPWLDYYVLTLSTNQLKVISSNQKKCSVTMLLGSSLAGVLPKAGLQTQWYW